MREIKFRAWDKKYKKMTYIDGPITWGQVQAIPYPELELMQYTGFKDSGEKDIYDGDILRVEYRDKNDKSQAIENHAVSWGVYNDGEYLLNCETWVVNNVPLSDTNNWTWGHSRMIIKIIGNIFENPELLKEEK